MNVLNVISSSWSVATQLMKIFFSNHSLKMTFDLRNTKFNKYHLFTEKSSIKAPRFLHPRQPGLYSLRSLCSLKWPYVSCSNPLCHFIGLVLRQYVIIHVSCEWISCMFKVSAIFQQMFLDSVLKALLLFIITPWCNLLDKYKTWG